ncbi:5046_t:CDS:2 [Funneliformis mosseae]|uniref:5046_t:CDS:1 n=1 Tax=Funneliformis mosseae TaxID=27381 RepID=A0A9N9HFA5_FUNMO|nr:5046_t:CDS:2 [Funneliformis mosseae]
MSDSNSLIVTIAAIVGLGPYTHDRKLLKKENKSVVDALASTQDDVFKYIKNKSLSEIMVKASDDNLEPVPYQLFKDWNKDESFICVKAMSTFLERLDDIKKGKVKKCYEKAEPEIPSKKASTNAVAPTFPKKSGKKIPNTSLLAKLLESKI